MSYASLSSHRTMALDHVRNSAYGRALAEVVGPDTVVLDLGAGTGLHGLMAARLGARHVYLVDPEDVIALADDLIELNGVAGRVTVLQGRIEDVKLPERVDVIVSALTGNFLVTEDLIASLIHARDHVLKPGGVLIPCAATMEAAPASAERAHAEFVAAWSTIEQGIDLGAARPYAANTIFYHRDMLTDVSFLAEPAVLHAMNFATDVYRAVHADVTVDINQTGVCHGWVGWSKIKLGGAWLSTAPAAERVHWSPAFLPLDPPIPLERGERMRFNLARVPQGDWTWSVGANAGRQQHSTLLSRPMTPDTLARAAVDFRPRLSPEGEVLQHVLALCDGTRPAARIAEAVAGRFPRRFPTTHAALAFVQQVVRRHT